MGKKDRKNQSTAKSPVFRVKTWVVKWEKSVHNKGMTDVAEIMGNVLGLPRSDRSYIARKLIESLDQEAELSPEWMAEIEQRVARRQSGETQSVSSEDVHADIERILAQ